ncbi:MAG: recombinase family protein, partial [Cellulosilyticaceae bacterium]
MKAALYVRVSTHFQIDKDSLPMQRKELENYSRYALGIEDYEIFEDAGYSAKNTDRPAYQNMMARVRQKEFTHIIVWKIDRVSRNLLDFATMYEEIKKHGVTFVSKNEQFDTSSAMGEAMLKIILIFAELERKLTGERVYQVMLSRAEKGQWNGATVPLGYKWSDEIKFPVVDEFEANIVKYIYNLYDELQSTTKIAVRLNKEHVPTKRGGTWTAKTINDILHNPFYIGTYRYNVKDQNRRWKDKSEWIVLENNHEPIISKD